ncbi:MAG: hypothetical protein A3F70_11220 [Acidobacteria bacterium RIFCSPLOWO2_12_FULL_67_14]|nr:MAG: hypothetical protein A3H29_17035 [Acidobacteria bacterium RIFCSPLOWO2_02_FULL_67_21]OFW39111.1 MAG: hypothetical protein A3F70_11220 [Acidobacteria bacterium RIFCSPLOWO2_12_FULL_67_14]
MTQDQRAVVLDKFPDVANLAVGALVFGQFLGSESYSLALAAAGIAAWSALIVITLVIAGGHR